MQARNPKSEPAHANSTQSKLIHHAVTPHRSDGCDRSNNIILLGLSKQPLLDTKSAIDNMTTHLIGKTIRMVDAFRIGRKPLSNSNTHLQAVVS